jgi:hypothetical protein
MKIFDAFDVFCLVQFFILHGKRRNAFPRGLAIARGVVPKTVSRSLDSVALRLTVTNVQFASSRCSMAWHSILRNPFPGNFAKCAVPSTSSVSCINSGLAANGLVLLCVALWYRVDGLVLLCVALRYRVDGLVLLCIALWYRVDGLVLLCIALWYRVEDLVLLCVAL